MSNNSYTWGANALANIGSGRYVDSEPLAGMDVADQSLRDMTSARMHRPTADRLTKSGKVFVKSYDEMLKSTRFRDPGFRKVTGDAHLRAWEEFYPQALGQPGFWSSYDLGRYGMDALVNPNSPIRKSMGFTNNLGRQYFGPSFQGDQTVADLAKAMATQNIGGTFGDATPLRLQNLDATMTSVLYEEQHFVKWNWFERVPSIQPYYEWNDRQSYGDDRGNPAFVEGGTPYGGTAQFSRNGIYVRYFGVRRGITHQMALTGQLGGSQVDPVEEENRDGAMQLLARVERNFIWGDHTVLDANGNIVNYDGLVLALQNGVQYVGNSQTNPVPYGYTAGKNILDMQGQYFDFSLFEGIGRQLAQLGFLTSFKNVRAFMKPTVLEDLAKMRLVTEFKQLVAVNPAAGYTPGIPLAGYQSNFGFVPFTYDLFLNRAGMTDQPVITAGQQSPAAPVVGTAPTAAAPTGSQTSYFLTASASKAGVSDAGTYYYWASAGNDSGESLTTYLGSVAVAAGQVVNMVIDPGTSNGQPLTWMRIYRGTVNSTTDDGTGCIETINAYNLSTVSFTDENAWRPQTGMIVMVDRTPSNLAIAQMLPMLKWPLAITSTTVEWLILLYHALVVKAPQRMYIIKNIGRLNPAGLPGQQI